MQPKPHQIIAHRDFYDRLRLWLVSMMTLMIFKIAHIYAVVSVNSSCREYDDWACPTTLGDAMLDFGYHLVILILWHVADLLQSYQPHRRIIAVLTSYRLLFVLLLVVYTGSVAWATGWYTSLAPCGDLLSVLSASCYVVSPYLETPVLAAILLVMGLCVIKIAFVAYLLLMRKK
ncbi:hypothetical protein [Parasphingorhabdus sp.]|uniref:hypothetical protein n=1 Tax=Parasphingorhabdus sp. TaxID=2709688 RepID=UPI0032ECD8D4